MVFLNYQQMNRNWLLCPLQLQYHQVVPSLGQIFSFLFVISLFADFIANEKPLLVKYDSNFYYPIFSFHSETTFGGDFETEADYKDPYVKNLIEEKGWMIMPIIPYSYNTIIRDLSDPAP